MIRCKMCSNSDRVTLDRRGEAVLVFGNFKLVTLAGVEYASCNRCLNISGSNAKKILKEAKDLIALSLGFDIIKE